MTLGDRIWAEALGKIGVTRLWASPVAAVTELGREVVEAINSNFADPTHRRMSLEAQIESLRAALTAAEDELERIEIAEEAARHPERSVKTKKTAAHEEVPRPYTPAEDAQLLNVSAPEQLRAVAAQLGRSYEDVAKRRQLFEQSAVQASGPSTADDPPPPSAKPSRRYTPEQEAELLNASSDDMQNLATKWGRSYGAIEKKREVLLKGASEPAKKEFVRELQQDDAPITAAEPSADSIDATSQESTTEQRLDALHRKMDDLHKPPAARNDYTFVPLPTVGDLRR